MTSLPPIRTHVPKHEKKGTFVAFDFFFFFSESDSELSESEESLLDLVAKEGIIVEKS